MKLIKREFYCEPLQRDVRLYIGLPKTYDLSNRRYPVLYMQDGHNVFLKEDSFIGHTWQMLEMYDKHPNLKEIIVVAMDASSKENGRLYEYSPFVFNLKDSDFDGCGGGGDVYLDYLVNHLKPSIDSEFRTLSEQKHTAIMGSSLGGFISIYAGLKYPKTFGKLASLSGSFFVALKEMLESIELADMSNIDLIYMDSGDQEVAGGDTIDYLKSNEIIMKKLVKKIGEDKVVYKVIKGGKHSEVDWSKRLRPIIQTLFD